jgi:hypothetical protein
LPPLVIASVRLTAVNTSNTASTIGSPIFNQLFITFASFHAYDIILGGGREFMMKDQARFYEAQAYNPPGLPSTLFFMLAYL